jgi:hypothetical protein
VSRLAAGAFRVRSTRVVFAVRRGRVAGLAVAPRGLSRAALARLARRCAAR